MCPTPSHRSQHTLNTKLALLATACLIGSALLSGCNSAVFKPSDKELIIQSKADGAAALEAVRQRNAKIGLDIMRSN